MTFMAVAVGAIPSSAVLVYGDEHGVVTIPSAAQKRQRAWGSPRMRRVGRHPAHRPSSACRLARTDFSHQGFNDSGCGLER